MATNYILSPPKHLTNSQWQSMFQEFMAAGGPDIEKYRPGARAPATTPQQAAGGSGTIEIPSLGVGGPTPEEVIADNNTTGQEAGTTGEAGAVDRGTAGGGAGYDPNRNVYVGDPGRPFNPVDDGRGLIDIINQEFPQGQASYEPGRFEQFMVNYGPKVAGAVGWMNGIPGMGWLANKITDWYWQNNAWASDMTPEQLSWRPEGGDIHEGIRDFLGEGPQSGMPEAPSGLNYSRAMTPGSNMGIFGSRSILNYPSRITRQGS